MKKRIISAVLAAVVALSAVPASALPPAVAEEKTETAILEEQETGIQDMAVENAETETSDTSDDTAGGEPETAPEGDAGEEPAEEEFGGNTEQDEPTDQGAAGQLPEEDDLLITAPPEPEGTVPDNNLPENTENRLPESQDTETPVWTTEDMEDDAEDNTEEDTAESFQIQIPEKIIFIYVIMMVAQAILPVKADHFPEIVILTGIERGIVLLDHQQIRAACRCQHL